MPSNQDPGAPTGEGRGPGRGGTMGGRGTIGKITAMTNSSSSAAAMSEYENCNNPGS